MYKLTSALCSLIREEVFPDAFEGLADTSFLGIIASIGGLAFLIHEISYAMCGIFYSRGDGAWVGSIGYTVFLGINTYIIVQLVKWFDSIYIILLIYLLVAGILYIALNKLNEILYRYS